MDNKRKNPEKNNELNNKIRKGNPITDHIDIKGFEDYIDITEGFDVIEKTENGGIKITSIKLMPIDYSPCK